MLIPNDCSLCNTKIQLLHCLIFISLILFIILCSVASNFLVVFLEGSQILTSLGELSFLHTLSDIPVDKGSLGVHQIEFVIETSPSLGNGSGVGQHAHGTLDLGKITSRNDSGWLVVDADLEASGTPVDKLDSTLGLDVCDGCVYVLGHYISAEQKTASHVLAVTRIALHHLVGRLEARVGDISNAKLLVVSFLSRDYWSISHQRKVNTWVGNQVSLELCKIDIQSTIETQRSGD